MPEFLLGLDTEPMEAKSIEALPAGDGWQFEPKWGRLSLSRIYVELSRGASC